MPFCCQCGKAVSPHDVYCASCGARQASAAAASKDYFGGVNPRTAAVLCYIPIVGWIPSIVVLAAARFRDDRNVRFHAFQGLYLFVAWLIVDWVLSPMLHFSLMRYQPIGPIKLALIGVWIYMMITTSQDRQVRLPILGELADRSVSEQR